MLIINSRMDVSELHQKIKMYRGTPKKIFYTVSTMSKRIETQLGKWKSADSICIPMLVCTMSMIQL